MEELSSIPNTIMATLLLRNVDKYYQKLTT